MRCYLDHNATAPLRPEAKAAAEAAMGLTGNASSVHAEGRAARALIEEARLAIGALLNAKPKNITFTSGGSEAAAHLLTPGFRREGQPPATKLIVSSIEHSCVLAGGRFAPEAVSVAPVTREGIVDLKALEQLLAASNEVPLVALMLANNETGIIQPVAEAAKLVHARGGYLVCDTVQALGKLEFTLDQLGADAIFISGHKIGALPGTGAVIRAHDDIHIPPLIRGGGQEGGLRAGSENLAGIASFGTAARILGSKGAEEREKIRALRDFMEQSLRTISPLCEIIGEGQNRLVNTSAIVVPGRKAETLLIALDMAGIAVGAGSACTSGKLSPSHVLTAMGRGEQDARAALRVSLGWSTTKEDVDFFCAEWARLRTNDDLKVA